MLSQEEKDQIAAHTRAIVDEGYIGRLPWFSRRCPKCDNITNQVLPPSVTSHDLARIFRCGVCALDTPESQTLIALEDKPTPRPAKPPDQAITYADFRLPVSPHVLSTCKKSFWSYSDEPESFNLILAEGDVELSPRGIRVHMSDASLQDLWFALADYLHCPKESDHA